MQVDFDVAVAAEDVGAYKPSDAPLRRALSLLEVDAVDVLHVAAGYDYDIPPATAIGVPTVWLNRVGARREGSMATFECRTLWALTA